MKFKTFINEDNVGTFDVRNIENEAIGNDNFRNVLFTGKNLQLVVMSLLPNEDIGNEVHNDVDQFFRIEEGKGKVILNNKEIEITAGSSILIVAGTQHNIVNTSYTDPLKLYTLYSPPHHPDGIYHKTKADAIASEKE